MRKLLCRATHFGKPRSVLQQIDNALGKQIAGELRLRDEKRCAGSFKRLGVARLVIVGRARERSKDSRLPGRGDLGNSARSRAADDQVRSGKGARHVCDEGGDIGSHSSLLVTSFRRSKLALARLVNDLDVGKCRTNLRQRAYNGRIDGSRSLAATEH